MLRILAIGNSFSEDATRFLHPILDAAGVENKIVNLYIGGCPLERHWHNIEENSAEYEYQPDGEKTDHLVSIDEVLDGMDFDIISTQQASGDSGWENTYEPFLELMLEHLKARKPNAKYFLHQTWAYETGSLHPHFMRYHRDQQEMFERLRKAYGDAASRHGLTLIPTGELVQKLRASGMFDPDKRCICRDGFHLSYLYGRYAAALLWAKCMAGIDVLSNAFVPEFEGEIADAAVLDGIKQQVQAVWESYYAH